MRRQELTLRQEFMIYAARTTSSRITAVVTSLLCKGTFEVVQEKATPWLGYHGASALAGLAAGVTAFTLIGVSFGVNKFISPGQQINVQNHPAIHRLPVQALVAEPAAAQQQALLEEPAMVQQRQALLVEPAVVQQRQALFAEPAVVQQGNEFLNGGNNQPLLHISPNQMAALVKAEIDRQRNEETKESATNNTDVLAQFPVQPLAQLPLPTSPANSAILHQHEIRQRAHQRLSQANRGTLNGHNIRLG
jgi:hypothetical protein